MYILKQIQEATSSLTFPSFMYKALNTWSQLLKLDLVKKLGMNSSVWNVFSKKDTYKTVNKLCKSHIQLYWLKANII